MVHRWLASVLDLIHQVVFLCVFLQFVTDSADNVLNLGLEQLLERVDRDVGRLLLIALLKLLLFVQDLDDLSVVVTILLSVLAIVKIDQHVGQALVQSILHMISGVLGTTLAALRLLVVVVIASMVVPTTTAITVATVCILVVLVLVVSILSILVLMMLVLLVLVLSGVTVRLWVLSVSPVVVLV